VGGAKWPQSKHIYLVFNSAEHVLFLFPLQLFLPPSFLFFFSLPFCARPSRFCYTESAWRSRTCEHGQGRVKHCRPVLGKSAAYPTNMNAVLKKYIFNAQCKRGFLKIKARVPVIVKVTIIASTLLLRRSMREGHFSIQTHSLPGASSAAQCAS